MKILEITFMAPNKRSGGGLGVYQSIKSLAKNTQVDYIGPFFEKNLFGEDQNNIHIHTILSPRNISKIKAIYRLLLHKVTTSYYDTWIKAVKNINWEEYAFVHIEFSRYIFLINICHKNKKKCVVRVHNIETDYGYNIYKHSRNIYNFVRFISFKSNEKKVLEKGDKLVFLTKEDISRAISLYKIETSKILKNPVCIDGYRGKFKIVYDKKIEVLITGSLNYEPNVDGIIWFLENVWNKIEKQCTTKFHLIIAGAHPTNELKEYTQNNFDNIQLIDTPKKMESYFLNADIYIASVFDGAGMKVKVAEAFSYGLPIIGTTHAFIGYENIIVGKYFANSETEFLDILLNSFREKTSIQTKNSIRQCFEEELSMGSSIKRYYNIIKEFEDNL